MRFRSNASRSHTQGRKPFPRSDGRHAGKDAGKRVSQELQNEHQNEPNMLPRISTAMSEMTTPTITVMTMSP